MSSDPSSAATSGSEPSLREDSSSEHVGTRSEHVGTGSAAATRRYLSKEEMRALDDDAFFSAYAQGKIQRRDDAWTEENFEEEMEKVPLFMSREPTKRDYVENPHLQAMQAIFEEEYTPTERAEYHKQHGNEAFNTGKKHTNKGLRRRDLHKAVFCYTEGLKERPDDKKLVATLLCNRAAVNLLLGNRGMVIADCTEAIELEPSNIKAYYRAAQAAYELHKYEECLDWCDKSLRVMHDNPEIIALRQKAVKGKAAQDRVRRMEEARERKAQAAKDALEKAVQKRGIQFAARRPQEWWRESTNEELSEKVENICSATIKGPQVDEQGVMYWPILFVYPEPAHTDFVEQAAENDNIFSHLLEMFPDQPEPAVPWDIRNEYKASRLSVYYEEIYDVDRQLSRLIKVDVNQPLLKILQEKSHWVYGNMVLFIVLVEGSAHERSFLAKYGQKPDSVPMAGQDLDSQRITVIEEK